MKIKQQSKFQLPPNIKSEHSAFNMWLHLLDQLLDKQVPIANAMVLAGNQLQQSQKEHHDTLFHPVDLYLATETINILLRRRPEYTQRTKGWAKS